MSDKGVDGSQIRTFMIIRILGNVSEIRHGAEDSGIKLNASKSLYRLIYFTFIKVASIAHKSHTINYMLYYSIKPIK